MYNCTYFALFEFFGLRCWGPAASLLNFIEHISGAKYCRDGQFLPLLITMRGSMALRSEVPFSCGAEGRWRGRGSSFPMAAEGERGALFASVDLRLGALIL